MGVHNNETVNQRIAHSPVIWIGNHQGPGSSPLNSELSAIPAGISTLICGHPTDDTSMENTLIKAINGNTANKLIRTKNPLCLIQFFMLPRVVIYFKLVETEIKSTQEEYEKNESAVIRCYKM